MNFLKKQSASLRNLFGGPSCVLLSATVLTPRLPQIPRKAPSKKQTHANPTPVTLNHLWPQQMWSGVLWLTTVVAVLTTTIL